MVLGGSLAGLEMQVLAPVMDHARGAAGRVSGVLTDVWHGFRGSPVMPNGTNWNGYSHEELQEMLHGDANPGQVGSQAAVMDGWASVAAGAADDVTVEKRSVPAMWRGAAADNAVKAMAAHAEGGGEVQGHWSSIARALSLASEALSRAQHSMPAPVPVDTITKYGAMIGGVGGGLLGMNPVTAGAGAVAGGAASHFGASVFEARNKGQAVAVMQRFERDLQDALAQISPPAKLPPGPSKETLTELVGPNTSTSGTGTAGSLHAVGAAGPAASPPTTSGFTPNTSGAPGLLGGSTPTGFTPAGLGRPGTSSIAASGMSGTTSAAGSGAGLPGGAGRGLGGGVSGGVGGGVGGGGGVPWGELTGRGALAGAMPDLLSGGLAGEGGRPGVGGRSVGGGAARGASGGPGMPGMGAGGRGQQGEEDAEHRNKMLQSENLFAPDIDEVVAPPVLGDWANQE